MKKSNFKSIEALRKELVRQREASQDLIVDTSCLSINSTRGSSVVCVATNNALHRFNLQPNAHKQLSEFLGIPYRYYQRLLLDKPKLFDDTINALLTTNHQKRLLRITDGNIKAFLSDRYKPLNSIHLLDRLQLELSQQVGYQMVDMAIEDGSFVVKMVNRGKKAEVAGSTFYSGVVVINDETGNGSVRVQPSLFKLKGKTWVISGEHMYKKHHLGKQITTDRDYYVFEQTLSEESTCFASAVKRASDALQGENFDLMVNQLRKAQQIDVRQNPIKIVEVLTDKYMLTKQDKAAVLMHYIKNGNMTIYGLINALSCAAKDNNSCLSAVKLERIGGLLLTDAVGDNEEEFKSTLPKAA